MYNIRIIFTREYISRIKDKWFWITTILVPVGIIFITLLPLLLSRFGGQSQTTLLIIGVDSDLINELPKSTTENLRTETSTKPLTEALQTMEDSESDISAIANFSDIDPKTNQYSVTVTSRKTLSLSQEGAIQAYLTPIIQQLKLSQENIRPDQAARLLAPVTPTFTTINENDASATQAYGLAYGTGIIMYFILLFYGTNIMRSVQEEKKNRIIEILLSSIKPFELLLGKISGVVAVGITQIIFWISLVLISSPILLGILAKQEQNAIAKQISLQTIWEQAKTFSQTFDLFIIVPLFLAYLLTGLLLYAGIFSAIAASADSDSDIQSLSGIAIIPIVSGFMTALAIVINPDTGLAFWTSLIPFISPLTMMARLPFGVPTWQIATSLSILTLTAVGTIWISAKIYRIGILLYGERLGLKHIRALFEPNI